MTDLQKIIDHYGEEHQLNKVVEELNELLEALNNWRNKRATGNDVIDEIADVKIMMNQLEIILSKKHHAMVHILVESRIEFKIARTLTRIENDNNKS
jgi:hypothetical protein